MSLMTGEERVTFVASVQADEAEQRFIPQVAGHGTNIRPFQAEDMARVLDHEGADVSPPDGGLMYCEYAGGTEGLQFPVYYCCLRGGYMFYFEVEDVDDEGTSAMFHAPPKGVVPLSDVEVEYPPGGRRVFREHAHTDARNGYEFAIFHSPKNMDEDGQPSSIRPPVFLVADSLGRRERWSSALKLRASEHKPTFLRGGYTKTAAAASAGHYDSDPRKEAALAQSKAVDQKKDGGGGQKLKSKESFHKKEKEKSHDDAFRKKDKGSARPGTNRKGRSTLAKPPRTKDAKTLKQQVMNVSHDEGLAAAVLEFGIPNFQEQEWMDNFFQIHNDFDAPTQCRQMEQWQNDMKKNLKGAVLQQYEYFVQASGEMTTMGQEVSSLKTLVETQVETIKEMKEIDFGSALNEDDGKDELMGREENEKGRDDRSMVSEVGGQFDFDEDENNFSPIIEIPEWIKDADEEISALIRECRYSDAIDYLHKASAEVVELFDKHERPTAYRLRKAQIARLESLQKSIDLLTNRISHRLEETLRRKNEALRQASKRERADASTASMGHGHGMAMISPCALSDDTLYLQLLVKIGRNHQAAEAYSARRSLLLLETLHERPISGSGSVDLVIYAAQLSQSFFSSLASSVEGFLDLFLAGGGGKNDGNHAGNKDTVDENMSTGDSSSIHSSHNFHSKSVPAGAVSAVVLWCDAELYKFAGAFGGTRILANLALSPPTKSGNAPRVVGQESIAKERQNAIQVAAQCLEQAFAHASSNLDAVGLPLTPRLAEYLRGRLKGCEGEISVLLDEKWSGLTSDWQANDGTSRR